MTTFTRERLERIIDSANEIITAQAGTNEELHTSNTEGMIKAYDYLNDVAATPRVVRELARIALAAMQQEPEREQIRREHAEWSQATFGDVGPVGPLKHLSKEALEAAAAPGDLSEWADLQFLLWDAQRRAGITDEQITAALEEKLKVNMARQWPEPKDGEPRLHIKP